MVLLVLNFFVALFFCAVTQAMQPDQAQYKRTAENTNNHIIYRTIALEKLLSSSDNETKLDGQKIMENMFKEQKVQGNKKDFKRLKALKDHYEIKIPAFIVPNFKQKATTIANTPLNPLCDISQTHDARIDIIFNEMFYFELNKYFEKNTWILPHVNFHQLTIGNLVSQDDKYKAISDQSGEYFEQIIASVIKKYSLENPEFQNINHLIDILVDSNLKLSSNQKSELREHLEVIRNFLFFDYKGQSDDLISQKNIADIMDKLKIYAQDYFQRVHDHK